MVVSSWGARFSRFAGARREDGRRRPEHRPYLPLNALGLLIQRDSGKFGCSDPLKKSEEDADASGQRPHFLSSRYVEAPAIAGAPWPSRTLWPRSREKLLSAAIARRRGTRMCSMR